MKTIIILFLATSMTFAANFSVYEANYPGVKDNNVNLEEAILTVKPQGAFLEMTLELTVSYDFKSWFFKNYNELEFLWEFSLPDQASVTDFWIWLDDTLLQATMLDRWTAELLFSEVSSPVRNPALLTQSFPNREGQVNYNVRLYPIMRDVKRKFKIEYILPARPTNETLRVWLPVTQLTSRISPGAKELHVIFMDENEPTLLGAEIIEETFNGQMPAWEFDIRLDYDMFVELVYPSPIEGKHFFSTFDKDGESFYQLAVYPPEVEEARTDQNFLILVDYNRFNTDALDGELVLTLLKETMMQALSERDSANIVVAFEDLTWGANDLVSCSEANLDQLFQNVLMRSFPSYSNFQVLMASAADFLRNKTSLVDVILFTNTDEISDINRELYANEILLMFPKNVRIHIVDLENISSLVYYQSQYVAQLYSFYAHMCNQTGGNLFFLRYHSIKNILAALFYENISHFQEVEVQTRFASGYAFGKHLIALNQGYYPLHFPIMQIGRFNGALPLDVTVLGKVRLDKSIDEFTITDDQAVPGNEKLALSWYADHIHGLLQDSQTNATVIEIMDKSLENRVLTPYTGFLVFRPGENNGFDPEKIAEGGGDNRGGDEGGIGDGGWEGDPTGVEDRTDQPEQFKLELQAYPNPFNMAVSIKITLPENVNRSGLHFAIFNALGQQIKEFDIQNSTANEIHLTWDGQDESGEAVASGIYFVVLYGPELRKTLKLVLIK